MEFRTLGKSDLNISTIGLGSWAIGGSGWLNGWGSQEDSDSITTIQRAVERGINWVDTAAVYGLGHSEEVVGRAVKGMRERPYIFTKCSRVWETPQKINGILKADSIRQECENSLRRLGVDVIDLYQIHWPNPDEDIEEGWSTLAALQREGKVRYIGVSNFNVSQLKRIQNIAQVTSLQPPYSLIRRDIEQDILPYCQEHNIGVIVYSPMASGMLSGRMSRERALSLPADDWRSRNDEFKEPRLTRNLEVTQRLAEIAATQHANAGAAAIAWALRHPAVTGAIVGARHPEQIDEIVAAASVKLSDTQAAELEALA